MVSNLEGQIIKSISGFYDIKTNDNIIYRTRALGSFRNKEITPLVGDNVYFNKEGQLLSIKDRKNHMIRPKIANIDQVAIFISLKEPDFSSLLLDKFLMIVEHQEIKPVIIFTKKDLYSDSNILNEYLMQNYICKEINNKEFSDEYIEWFSKEFKNKLTAITGQSGVGKTSFLNNFFNLNNETNKISKALNRGVHTTRVVEIFSKNNISIIDTPGFSSLEIKLTKLEKSKSYKNFRELSKMCEFSNCIHFKEVKCEIKEALARGEIPESRYKNYLKILNESNETN